MRIWGCLNCGKMYIPQVKYIMLWTMYSSQICQCDVMQNDGDFLFLQLLVSGTHKACGCGIDWLCYYIEMDEQFVGA